MVLPSLVTCMIHFLLSSSIKLSRADKSSNILVADAEDSFIFTPKASTISVKESRVSPCPLSSLAMYSPFFCVKSLKSSRSTAAASPGFPRTCFALIVQFWESLNVLFLETLTEGEVNVFISFNPLVTNEDAGYQLIPIFFVRTSRL